jgi:hypothetical protein
LSCRKDLQSIVDSNPRPKTRAQKQSAAKSRVVNGRKARK